MRNRPGHNFTFAAARPAEGVFQLRGMKQLDAGFFYGADTATLFDLSAGLRVAPRTTLEPGA